MSNVRRVGGKTAKPAITSRISEAKGKGLLHRSLPAYLRDALGDREAARESGGIRQARAERLADAREEATIDNNDEG